MKVLLYALAFVLLFTPLFAQQTVSLTPAKDNTIYGNDASLSNGSGDYLFVGNTNNGHARRTLIAFDLTELPSDATIESVVLKMDMNKSRAGEHQLSLYRLTRDWGEGSSDASGSEGSGTSAISGEDATWADAYHQLTSWINQGGDFISEVSAIANVDETGLYEWGSTDQLVQDVQNWVNGTNENYGWIMIGDESQSQTAKRFYSRNEGGDSGPILEVTFQSATSLDEEVLVMSPNTFRLNQNYPNPFNPETTIPFQLGSASRVTLAVYDVTGQLQTVLLEGRSMSAGAHTVRLEASQWASGIYLYRLSTEFGEQVGRMTLIK